MIKEEFIKALESAQVDEHGRLYLQGKYDNKIYFGIITTICADLFDEYICDDETDEIYDRHFWDDDTLEVRVINNQSFNIKEMTKE